VRALSIQVQPGRASGIDMSRVAAEFERILTIDGLVAHHDFNHGDDRGAYFNYTFGTTRPGELWRTIQERIYRSPELGSHMQLASMAMCSSEEGWDTYLLLHHFDPAVTLDDATAL